MRRPEGPLPVPEQRIGACAATAMTLVYSAPMPGVGSRYLDGPVAHERKILAAVSARDALAGAARRSVGETVLEAVLSSSSLAGFADARGAGYLAPLCRAAALGERSGRVLRGLGHDEILYFVRAFEAAGEAGSLVASLRVALGAGESATLRDAMRFAATRDPLARDYARDYEISRQLARPALLAALSRSESARGALVHSYLEVLAEVPDLDVAVRAGRQEAEDVSRMANGVLKAGGVRSRRGIQAISNLDGLLRADRRLAPTATEPVVLAAAFMAALKHGPEALGHHLPPVTGRDKGR
ncbi:MAG: triphosphoribosyl-dephospho-CoA synthase [Rubrobacter sp.]|nr:triphosphoribosyl-dephospho-CoA synthase [Rubrobacter sp.]